MSYEILEAFRRACVDDTGVGALIEDRIMPRDPKTVERLPAGEFPLATFTMLDGDDDPCGRIDGIVQIEIADRENTKKKLWDVHRAIELATTPRLLQTAAESTAVEGGSPRTDLKIRIALWRLTSTEDNVFDEDTNTWRLRSQWSTKYIRKP